MWSHVPNKTYGYRQQKIHFGASEMTQHENIRQCDKVNCWNMYHIVPLQRFENVLHLWSKIITFMVRLDYYSYGLKLFHL